MSAGIVVAGPSDLGLAQRPQHPPSGVFAVVAPDDDLGDEVVVELADRVALVVAGVDPHPEAVRPAEAGDRARRGRKRPPAGILGVDPHLDGVPVEADVVLGEAERLARRDPQLEGHQVPPDHRLGGRVLDLEAGVHLQEDRSPRPGR